MGQLCEIAETFYKLDNLTVHILESKNDFADSTASTSVDGQHVIVKYRLDFDNREYVSIRIKKGSVSRNRISRTTKSLPYHLNIQKRKCYKNICCAIYKISFLFSSKKNDGLELYGNG